MPLSELAKTAKDGEEFDLGDGYFAVYHRYYFTIYNEMLELYVDGDVDLGKVTFSIEVPRSYMFGSDDLSFFNARYYWLEELYNNFHFWFVGVNTEVDTIPPRVHGKFVAYDLYSIERVGQGIAYFYEVDYDYSPIGYSVAFPVIVIDLIVCAVLCARQRNKTQ